MYHAVLVRGFHERAEGHDGVTGPSKTSPTWISRVRPSIWRTAASTDLASAPPTKTVPSSWMSMEAPVAAMIALMTLPPGPMTAPILPWSMWMTVIFGA
jgi:hypothetical protein